MINASVRAYFVSLIVGLFLTSLTAAESSPAFWQVSHQKTGSKVYLLGSMHFGHKNFYPLNSKITRAFDQSDVLAVELDITQIEPVKAMQFMLAIGQLPPGQTLKDQLDSVTWNRLRKRCQQLNIDVRAFQVLKPWFTAMQLVGIQLNLAEFKQSLGVDRYFLERVGNKEIIAFETMEQQLSLFDSLNKESQVEFLRETLAEFDLGKAYLLKLADLWQQGDTSNLEKLIIKPLRDNPKTAALFKKIFTDRNHRMTDKIINLLNSSKTAFVVVGAGHLIGTDGIVGLLKDKGWSVKRL